MADSRGTPQAAATEAAIRAAVAHAWPSDSRYVDDWHPDVRDTYRRPGWRSFDEREAGVIAARQSVIADAVLRACQPLQDEIDRLRAAIRDQAERWRNYQPGGFYPEASAYANAIENCGDALIDLLDELAAVQVGTGNSAELAQQ